LLQWCAVVCALACIGFGIGELYRAWPDGLVFAGLPLAGAAGLLERLALVAQLGIFAAAALSIRAER
jgi:hypothetical protein